MSTDSDNDLAPVVSIKGFNRDLTCKPDSDKPAFQFEIGKTYTVSGTIEACSNGFHACPIDEHPLSVLEFYPPTSRFCEVVQEGERDRNRTKLASASITIKAEISISDLAARAVKWVFDRANWKDAPHVTGENDAATASGTQGAATASGTWGAATASGYDGRVSGADGCALFLVERDDEYEIVNVWAGIAGRDGIKPGTLYHLVDGKPVEVQS